MSHVITGVAADFDHTVTFTETAPSDGDALTAASIEDNSTVPKTAEQATANAIEWTRIHGGWIDLANTWSSTNVFTGLLEFNGGGTNKDFNFHDTAFINFTDVPTTRILVAQYKTHAAGNIWSRVYYTPTGTEYVENASWADGAPGQWTADAAGACSLYMQRATSAALASAGTYFGAKVAGAAAWNDGFGAGAWTKTQQLNADGSAVIQSLVTVNSTIATSGGNINSGGTLSSATSRSSATGGAGQSVAVGTIYADTTVFAWGKVTVDAMPQAVLVRGANVASVSRVGAGIYLVTLQTAATNVLCPSVTALDDSGTWAQVDSGNLSGVGPTTTAFRVLLRSTAGLIDPGGTTGGFYFTVNQG